MPKKEIYQKNKEKYKQATTDNGGATTKLSREGASLKHTAKVRPTDKPKEKHICQFTEAGGNCGYGKSLLALQLDHKRGDGKKDSKIFRGNSQMYRYYLKHIEEAKEKLQTLCANCNMIKRYKNKELNNKYDIVSEWKTSNRIEINNLRRKSEVTE